MKVLIVMIGLMFSSLGFSETIASYDFYKVNEGRGYIFKIVVDDSSKIFLQVRHGSVDPVGIANFDSVRNRNYAVGSMLFKELFSDIVSLSRAEIKTTEYAAVCDIMVVGFDPSDDLVVARDYDSKLNVFRNGPKLVDSASNCWLSSQTHPVQMNDQNTAKALKNKLKALALLLVDQKN